jgi:CRP-like cAMP-binding protein
MTMERFLQARENALDADERQVVENAILEMRHYDARRTIIRREVRLDISLYLVKGIMCRYLDNRRGDRQLLSIQVPGDFVDLHGYPLKALDHDVATMTDAQVAIVPHAEIDRIIAAHPSLARKLWFATLLDAALHREWIFKLGRLPAQGRVAHFLCETELRLRAVDLSNGASFELPLTQSDIAEICGLTSIHVNRVLRDLRERGLCTLRGGIVEIQDRAGLVRVGEFDPGYLYLDPAFAGAGDSRRRKTSG